MYLGGISQSIGIVFTRIQKLFILNETTKN